MLQGQWLAISILVARLTKNEVENYLITFPQQMEFSGVFHLHIFIHYLVITLSVRPLFIFKCFTHLQIFQLWMDSPSALVMCGMP